MSAGSVPIEVFYSYADADKELQKELDKHLGLLKREGLISTFHKRSVAPGLDWTKALDQHLNTASVILLLVSADFVASDYCYGIEMQRAMERQRAGEAHVIPILLRPVDWQRAPFGKLNALPSDGRPVTRRNRDQAFADIVQGIRTVLGYSQRRHENDELRKYYLEKISTRYHAVTLPIGPSEGLSLQAIFQPLALRRDPLTTDQEHKQQRAPLGEDREGERSEHHRKDGPNIKGQSVIAEHSEEALQKSPKGRLVILGGPGTGKTTTLKYLIGRQAQKALTDPTQRTPIFLSLADLARSGKPLPSYLLDLIEDLGVERSYADTLWHEIKSGHAFVALDSLDEVAPDQRPRMIDLINNHASEHGNTWVIGSRFTEYKGGQFKQSQFSEWELLPMDKSLRQELATKLLPEMATLLTPTAPNPLSPTAFVTELEEHPHAAAWGDNPLLFSLAAVVFIKTGGLPASRATLYQQVVDAVLETREKDQVRRRSLRRVISHLALELYKVKGRTFSLDDLLSLLPVIRQKQHENWSTEETAHRTITSGMLDILAHETYSFRHQTFQEYLAAVELAQRLTSQDPHTQEEVWQFIWKKRTYSRWTEVLCLMVGALAQLPGNKGRGVAFRWMKALLDQRDTKEGDPGELGLALALKSAIEVTEIPEWKLVKTVQLEMQLVRLWWHELLMAVHNGRETKAERLKELVQDVSHLQLCEKEAISKPLVLALRDFDEEVRDTASTILCELSDWVSIHRLLPMLEDTKWYARKAAIEVLGTKRERVSLDVLLPMLEDTNRNVRRAAVQVLGKRVPPDVLLPMLEDKDEYVRESTVRVLGKRVPPDVLLPMLEDKGEHVREATVQVLGKRVPPDVLLPMLKDTEWDVRQAVVQILKAQGERVSLDVLLPMLEDTNRNVREATIRVLGKRVPLDVLLPMLEDINGNVRWAAVQVLGERVPLDILLPMLEDTNRNVREATVQVLGKRVPLDVLLSMLEDKDEYVRWAVVWVLKAQGESISFGQLMAVLWKPDWNVREAVVEILKAQGERVPLDVLLSMLEDKDEYVRGAVVEILKVQGERVPPDVLLPIIEDTDWNVRWAAVRVLKAQGERVPLDVLLPMLEDINGNVRWAVAVILEAQGERVPLDILLPMLEDTDWNVKETVAGILKAQGERVPLDVLLPMLEDKDEDVRRVVAKVLGERVPPDVLLPMLEDTYWMVRETAVQILGERVSLDVLLPMLEDKDEYVREAAVRALGEQVPLDVLLPMLEDKGEYVREAAVRALGERVPPDVLLPMLEDTNEYVREAAVRALGERVPLDVLLPMLEDKGEYVREAIVQVLKAQGERVPLDVLLPMLENTNRNVREAAVQVLGERVPPDVLLPMLEDIDGNVRRAVVQVLGKQMPVKAVLDGLKDENAKVREEAISILKEVSPDILSDMFHQAIAVLQGELIGEPFISIQQLFIAETLGDLGLSIPILLEKLTELLTWPFWQLRLKAIEAVGKIRRNIPDAAIRVLYDLRRNDPVRAVRDAADDALAEILSLETGIEDD